MAKTIIPTLILSALIAIVALNVTNSRVLLTETKVMGGGPDGESYVVEGYGDLGKRGQASLVCKYFNGRKITTTVFWYSASNSLGKDSCPTMVKSQ